ncbi:lipoprotein [Planococcus sp. YIM B11945]|uniref:lipoprotein n=1 Tax=Planococcus sp. YIM B11945 TaxID=3435410 RepID=UPI003D7D639C
MKKLIILAGLAFVLAGCSDSAEPAGNGNTADDGNSANENNAVDHGVEDESVGFTMDDEGKVEEAEVPEQEAEDILAAYGEYIAAFNAEDLARYMNVIAEKPDGFDREEDKASLEEAFKAYDTTYTTSNETIVEYDENRAEVFAEIDVLVKEPNTERSTDQAGRQVVVFKKENEAWKVTSLHFIGNSN